MNRLTYELGHKGTGEYEPNPHSIPISDYISCINKLGKLEDLEEQLGCPLDLVFKALEDGIYSIDKTFYPMVNMCFISKTLYCQAKFKDSIVLCIKDYKKTWWLKEDKSE